jgi:hypothetical protein
VKTLLLLFGLSGAVWTAYAAPQGPAHPVHIYLFWEKGCPHCEKQIAYVARVAARDPAVHVHYLELGSLKNRQVYAETARSLGLRSAAVPLTVVGATALVGSTEGIAMNPTVEDLIAQCRRNECADVLEPIVRGLGAKPDRELAISQIGGEPHDARPHDESISRKRIEVPWFGAVEIGALSLPALTIALAAVDGLNPCAMWVLVFLISLLLGLQDRARRWLLGGAFLLATAVVYYAVIAAWLSALMVIGVVTWLRIGIGIVALGGGAYYVWEYVRNPGALCRVAGEARRQRIMAGLRAATREPRFLIALAAIVALAVGVNFIELLCSAGIPAVYTQILALTPMAPWQHYGWLGLYVLVFLLDDLLIFIVAMVTLEITGVTARYAHHAQLVGGIVLSAVGLLLILRPEWLSFG